MQKAVKTTTQALAQQKADAERDRKRLIADQPAKDEIERLTNQAIAPAKATSVAVPDTRTSQQAYLDEIAPPSSLVGRPIKFDGKAGKWLFADTDEEIDPNTDFVALCDEILIGWIKFNGKGEQPDRIQGFFTTALSCRR